ncbi:MAG: FAD-dependent oxidoreductase [Pseudomonadota bacterium]|nr:FAD-dependent oxidoreductase [Pseudomonadota bacterium]
MSILTFLAACVPHPVTEPDAPDVVDAPAPDTLPELLTGRAGPDPRLGADASPTAGPARVDVLIIGAGPAGLAAALEAWTAGATVQVLEREDTFGGAANWAGGLMLFTGTPIQAAAGVDDSPERLLAEWPSFTGGDAADPWVATFANQNVPMVYDWLAGLGVTWSGPGADASSGTTPRVHQVEGGGPALVAAIEAPLDGPIIRYDAEATELLRDRTGRVTGVRWRDRALDEEHVARASTVIVATGGFLHDLDRVRAERPDLVDRDLSYGSWPGADGNGLAMVEALGGATRNLDAVGLYAHGTPAPGDTPDELLSSVFSSAMWVNGLGARFVDESQSNGFAAGGARAAQPDGDAWAILGGPEAANAVFTSPEPDGLEWTFAALDDANGFATADNLGALAEALGVDSATLVAEAEAYNAFAAGLEPTDPWRDERSQARPVVLPPFYAVPIAITVAKGFGGVDVDGKGRVLDWTGAPIPGLYAAGELSGMAGGTLVGDHGFTGSLSAVVLGGRIAGAAAADEAFED